MSDPLTYMNELLQWRDPPPPDERWERKVATACAMIAERDAEIVRINRCNRQQRAEIERLTADNEQQRIAAGQTSDEWRALHKELRGEQEENERMKAQLYDAGIDYSTMASEIERMKGELADKTVSRETVIATEMERDEALTENKRLRDAAKKLIEVWDSGPPPGYSWEDCAAVIKEFVEGLRKAMEESRDE